MAQVLHLKVMRHHVQITVPGPWICLALLALSLVGRSAIASPPSRARLADTAESATIMMARSVGEKLDLPLPDDSIAKLVVMRTDLAAADRVTLTGRVEGTTTGWFVLASDDGHLAGACWLADQRVFDLRSAPGDPSRVLVSEVTPGSCGACGTNATHTVNAPSPAPFIAESPAIAGETCAPVIDVLILFTELARDQLGSDAAMRALAAASIASTNHCYENSGVPQRLRLAHVEAMSEVESGNFTTELIRLLNVNDGFYDNAHALRDRHGADLVSLFVGTVTGSCGVAFTMGAPSPNFAASGFSVVQQSCAVTSLSFAHELAHNMGCAHHQGDGSIGSFPYSHGRIFTGQSGTQWRTVMGGTSAFRIPFFSNPDITYDQVPTGVPINQPLPANNALSLNQTAAIVANFRTATLQDCNNNGRDDACDIALSSSDDLNTNDIPDECDAPACAADDDLTITAPGLASYDRFGGSIALTNGRVVIGSENDDDAGTFSGSAFVFRRQDDAWVIEDKLRATDAAPFDRFGHAVAMTDHEQWIIVGAYREGDTLSDTGAVYFFRRTETWYQTQRIVNPDIAMTDWFGWTVAFSGSGDDLRAIVGTPFDDAAVQDAGALYSYKLEGGTWVLEQKFTSSAPSIGARLGYTLGASSGSRIIAGAPFENRGTPDTGAAEVFRHDGNQWISEARLLAPKAAENDRFGSAVAISDDHAIVGVPGDDERGDRAGAAHTFTRRGPNWIHTGKLFAADSQVQANFGASASMRDDLAIIGAPLSRSGGGTTSGAAYTFQRSGDDWLPRAKFNPRDAAPSDGLGSVVAISPDAARVAVSSLFDDVQGTVDGGSVRLFDAALAQPDCNGNGLPDDCDLDAGLSTDADGNNQPDECEPIPACPADVDHNDAVNVQDVFAVISAWGVCGSPVEACEAADLAPLPVGDGVVNVQDLLTVIGAWGPCG